MYILSQDKKRICDCRSFAVEKNYGGKSNAKYCLIGESRYFFYGGKLLGNYATEEAALKELFSICKAIKDGEKIYEVK